MEGQAASEAITLWNSITGIWMMVSAFLFFRGHPLKAVIWPALAGKWLLEKVGLLTGKTHGGGQRDIGEVADELKKKVGKAYDPAAYMNPAKGVFLGLSDRKPIYAPIADLRKKHIQLVGASGSGKTVAATNLLAQFAEQGDAIVVFDPKDDEYMPGVLARYLGAKGKRLHLIDLRPDAPPQVNLFEGCKPHEVEELLITAFDLAERGDNADVFRLDDRRAAGVMSEIFEGGARNMAEMFAAGAQDERITEARKFWGEFGEIARLAPITAGVSGVDLADAIAKGEGIYIISSATHATAKKAAKMMLMRVVQIISARDRHGAEKPRPVALFLDELKHLLSVPAVTALGTIRDKGCHLILAHQSLGDLEDVAGINPRAVRGAVVDNTTIKLVYNLTDPVTADYFQKLSGEERVFVESVSKTKQVLGPEEGSFREGKRWRVDINMLTSLPPGMGVYYGLGPAWIAHIHHLPAGDRPKVEASSAARVGPGFSVKAGPIKVEDLI